MVFQDEDRFLVNRKGASYGLRVKDLYDTLNPIGNVTKPTILFPENKQGFNIETDDIIDEEPVLAGIDPDRKVYLQSDAGFADLGFPNPGPITGNLEVIQSEPYIPITTPVTRVTPTTGTESSLAFAPINLDIRYLEVGDTFEDEDGGNICTITAVNSLTGDVEVDGILTNLVGKRLVITNKVYQSKGEAVEWSYRDPSVKTEVELLVKDVNSPYNFIDPNNNRRQVNTIKFALPKGGSVIGRTDFWIISSPYDNDNKTIQLDTVVYNLNGVDFPRPPETNANDEVIFNVTDLDMTVEGVNVLRVTYMGGMNKATSDTITFLAKEVPFFRSSSGEKYYSRTTGDVLNEYSVKSRTGDVKNLSDYGIYEINGLVTNDEEEYFERSGNEYKSFSDSLTQVVECENLVRNLISQ